MYKHTEAKKQTHNRVQISFQGCGLTFNHVQFENADDQALPEQMKTKEPALLLVLLLSVSNDVNQVLIVQVPGHIRWEGGEHLLHLTMRKQTVLCQCQ